jgi:hypothetical protein
MAQAVSRRPLTGTVHVDKVAPGQVFLRLLRFSPVSFIPPVLHYLENGKKLIIIIIIIIFINGCTISLKAAVRP